MSQVKTSLHSFLVRTLLSKGGCSLPRATYLIFNVASCIMCHIMDKSWLLCLCVMAIATFCIKQHKNSLFFQLYLIDRCCMHKPMSSGSNVASSSHPKKRVEGEVVSSKSTRCMSNLPIKKNVDCTNLFLSTFKCSSLMLSEFRYDQ